MGSSSSGSGTTEIRYAGYIEDHHHEFLDNASWYRDALKSNSPFTAFTDIEVEDAFFGAGLSIANYTSLFQTYGTYMQGLDIDSFWTQDYNNTLNGTVVNELVSAEASLMDDDIETNVIPRLQTGMRDINSAISSSYVIGRSIIEDTRVKNLAKFSAQLKYNLVPIAQQRWQTRLDWNKMIVTIYAELMKFYYSAATDVNEFNYSMHAKNALWPFTILDYERAALGALQGAVNEKKDVAGASTASKVLSGALGGAAMGAMIGSSIGSSASSATQGGATVGQMASGAISYAGGIGALAGAALGAAAAFTY